MTGEDLHMTGETFDLAELLAKCEQEPIHAPGAVQPHGVLLQVDEDSRISVASANAEPVLGIPVEELLGSSLAEAVGKPAADAVAAAPADSPIVLAGPTGPLEAVVRRGDSTMLVEIEPASTVDLTDQSRLDKGLYDFYGASTSDQLLAQAADTIRELTGFDRVLVYRFDRDWNGEVVAEAAADGIGSFLGLRFPASDIPKQARDLYARARLRLIPDAAAAPAPLLAVDGTVAQALDLSDVGLRAVSPVHLQYLHNMGVRSSMSVAIMLGDRLWGLVACHHLAGPRRPSLRVRQAVDIVSRTTSTVLGALVAAESAGRRVAMLEEAEGLTQPLRRATGADPGALLAEQGTALAALLEAGGAAVVIGRTIHVVGDCPPLEEVSRIIAQARGSGADHIATDALTDLDPDWPGDPAVAAGALAVRAGDDTRWLVWFRPETGRTVRWGGDPTEKPVAPSGGHLSPRASFDEYIEQVQGRSVPWAPEQVDVAKRIARRMADFYTSLARREAELATVLQRTILMEQLPDIPSVDACVRYQPSSGQPLGGDWYDVFFRPHGDTIVALGDVAGHGTNAAATMAQLRNALRAYLMLEESITDALARLNELVLTLLPHEMATLLLVALEPATATLRIANAGHLPPVVVTPDGTRVLEEHHDPAIGVHPDAVYRSSTIRLPPDGSLVLYTDGLIERRRVDIDECIRMLTVEASSVAGETAELQCKHLLHSFSANSDVDDDVTVVVLRFLSDS